MPWTLEQQLRASLLYVSARKTQAANPESRRKQKDSMRTQGKPAVYDGQFDDESNGNGGNGMSDAGAIVAAGSALMQTRTQYQSAMAVQKPRDLKLLKARCMDEAELAGEDFFYSWTVKTKDGKRELVEGMSIEGAMILARNFGNCAIPTDLVVDAPQHWVICATFVDFETGFNVPRLFRQRKSQSTGKMDRDRALDIAFQIGQSKAQRNAIDKGMPMWLKKACMGKAQEAAASKYADVPKLAPKAVAKFASLGVSQAQLEEKLGVPFEQWKPRDLATLAAILRGVENGETTIDNEFAPEPEPSAPAAPAEAAPTAFDGAAAAPAPAPAPAPAAEAPATTAAPAPDPAPAEPKPEATTTKGKRSREPGED